MSLFIIVPIERVENLVSAIQNLFPQDSYKLPQGEWLISFSGTTRELSDQLGVSDGKNGPAVILSITNYYGRANTDIWEWIKVKLGND